ncbi:hypothetical protein [Carboxylicivirga sp. N1Y90]|uniref:hypothetical protein n=1 Tax=Carboxylicivirga fragile TaxID=3417571 RepID=UPI003D3573C6|nr:hypothetical protein [Marinilabiliaceae bacterium N1Y90]
MNTTLHGNIFSAFIASQPERIPLGTEYDNARWNSLWEFLKSKTDLTVYETNNLNDIDNVMLTQLSTGRGETQIQYSDKPFSSHKFKIKCNGSSSVYCIDETDPNNQKKYRSKNGYIFAFKDDLLATWEQLSLLPLKLKHPVRKSVEQKSDGFTSWSKLADYLTPFTDVVMIDNYILNDPSLIPSNLEKILEELDKATPVKYRLTIFTFEGGRDKLNGQATYDSLKEIKQRLQLKCEIELILANRAVKEHDRGIFTNYLTIRSGDSFNYFDSTGNIITHGTDITFGSMANTDEREATMATLAEVADKRSEIIEKNSDLVFGDCKNQLLENP